MALPMDDYDFHQNTPLAIFFILFSIIGIYISKMAKEIGDPSISPMEGKRITVAEYIG